MSVSDLNESIVSKKGVKKSLCLSQSNHKLRNKSVSDLSVKKNTNIYSREREREREDRVRDSFDNFG